VGDWIVETKQFIIKWNKLQGKNPGMKLFSPAFTPTLRKNNKSFMDWGQKYEMFYISLR